MLKLNKINVNEILDNEGWYNLSEEDCNKFNKDGYYKIKCKGDCVVESIEYIGKEFNVDLELMLDERNVIGVKDGYEYIRI